MAYFGTEELIDSIRHGLAIEDDTGFATKVLGRAAKRCKPGGLPLSFAAQTETSDSDSSPPFEIFSTKAMSTSTLCEQNIIKNAKDVQNLIQARRSQKPKLDQEQIDHFFNIRNMPVKTPPSLNSMLSRQIEECQATVSNEKFSEFARFEAFENEPNSKLIQIVFPFADHPPESPMRTLAVYAKNQASMDEFIGLCCFLYTRSGFTPKCSEPWRYSLYMADDSFVDTELPPIDRHRSVGKCGFTMLALVENKDELATRTNKYNVTVHTVSGLKFVFELDSLNESLEWLRDKALKRRDELNVQKPRVPMRQTTYELQTLDNEHTLKLSNTISSTGVLEFLLIRKNSSRANFNPTTLSDFTEPGLKPPLFVQTRQRPTDLRQTRPLSSSTSSPKLFNNVNSPTTSTRLAFGYGNLIQEYMVERVHRLKPRCSSKLVIRDDCLEITPVQVEKRRAFVPQATQKFTTIAWELIGGVDSERHGARRVTKITWLPVSSELFELQESYLKHLSRAQKRVNDNFYQETSSQALSESSRHSSTHSTNIDTDVSSSPAKTINSTRPSLNESSFNGGSNYFNDYDPTPLLKAYDSLVWKYIQIEASDDDSWQINMKIIEIIDAKNSVVRQIFHNSCGGSRKLRLAAEETFSLKAGPNYSPNEPKRQPSAITSQSSASNLKAYKKRKSINPVPLLNRMLSKQE